MKTEKPGFLNHGEAHRQWKAQKRKDLKNVLNAVSDYQMGCYFCPNYNSDIQDLFDILDKMKKSHSYKEWG